LGGWSSAGPSSWASVAGTGYVLEALLFLEGLALVGRFVMKDFAGPLAAFCLSLCFLSCFNFLIRSAKVFRFFLNFCAHDQCLCSLGALLTRLSAALISAAPATSIAANLCPLIPALVCQPPPMEGRFPSGYLVPGPYLRSP